MNELHVLDLISSIVSSMISHVSPFCTAMPNQKTVIEIDSEEEDGFGSDDSDGFCGNDSDEMELALLDTRLAEIQAQIEDLADQKVCSSTEFQVP